MIVAVKDVKVSRDRFRPATGDIEALAVSILKFGLLQPIVLDENMELLAGYRRLTAHQMNGAESIEATFIKDLTEIQQREIELEENIQRENMTWQERNKALAEIDRLKRSQDPNWTYDQTAALTGERGKSSISEAIKLDNAMQLFPELAKAKSKNQAMNWLVTKVGNIARVKDVRDNVVDYTNIEHKIWHGDSTELIKTVPDESFHAIITDPPFGIKYNERTAGTIGELTNYSDTTEEYERILGMAPEMYRTLKANGWLVFFYGMTWHTEVFKAFRDAGFHVDDLPIMWDRSDGRTYTNRPDRFFTRGYDVALHAYKGDAKIVQRGKPNVLRIPPVSGGEREFQVERPIELYRELIQRLTVKGETVADFFVGTGSCPAAAAETGRDFFGMERDAERRAAAILKIHAHSPK